MQPTSSFPASGRPSGGLVVTAGHVPRRMFVRIIRAARFLAVGLCLWPWLTPGARAQTPTVPGSVDTTLTAGAGPLGTVSAIVPLPGGQVLVAGGLKGVVRLNSDSSVDTAFNPGNTHDGALDNSGANGLVNALAVQSTGKIIVGGSFTTYNGLAYHGIVRLKTDGSVDTTFNPGAGVDGDVDALAVQSVDQIIVGGTFTRFDGQTCRNIAKLNANGPLDLNFVPFTTGGGTNGSVYALAVQLADSNAANQDQILVGGSFNKFFAGSTTTNCGDLIRLRSNGAVDTDFQPGAGADGAVNALVYSGSQILVGGSFDSFNTKGNVGGLIRLNGADGGVDAMFNPMGTGTDGSVITLTVQADGKIIAGGSFTAFNGAGGENGVVRFSPDGTVDTNFNAGKTGTTGAVYAVAELSDNSVLAGGSFAVFNDAPSNGLVQIASGATDSGVTLGAGANANVAALAIQAGDGKVVVAGYFISVNGVTRNHIARLNTDGSLDTSFDPGSGANGSVYGMAIQADGKVVIGGQFTSVGGVARNNIARLNPDGSLDTSFDPGSGTDGYVSAVAIQATGKIVIGGHFGTVNDMGHGNIARLNKDGTLDANFNARADGKIVAVLALAIEPDDRIIMGGTFSGVNLVEHYYIARLGIDGTLDTGFNPNPADGVHAIAFQTDGKIVIGGEFGNVGGAPGTHGIARLNDDGTVDTSFNSGNGAYSVVSAVAVQTDGKIIAGGSFFDSTGTVARHGIARLNANGSLDAGFDTSLGTDDDVHTIVVQASGKIVIGGAFTTFDGVASNYFARLDIDGSLDTDFPPRTVVPTGIETLAVQTDAQIIFGGSFSSFGNQARNAIARLKADNTLDTSFDLKFGSGDVVQAVALSVDNKQLYVGHRPTLPVDLDSQTKVKNPIIRCNNAGAMPTIDTTFKAGTDGAATALYCVSDNKVLIAGQFSQVNGLDSANLARLNNDGSLDGDYNITPDGAIRGLSVAPDDQSVFIVGDFTHVNVSKRNHVARVGPSGNLLGFNLPSLPDGQINAVKALTGGGALIGGNFSVVDGAVRRGVARLLSTGKVDTTFDPGNAVSGTVLSIAMQSDGKPLLGGFFNQTGSTTQKNVIRLNANGSLDTTYNPGTGPDAPVKVVRVQANGLAVLGGSFSTVDGQQRRGAVRLLSDPPVITSAGSATATIGKAFSYQIKATHSPSSFLVANTQPGFTLDRGTGLLTGTPKGPAGTFMLTLKAANFSGVGTKAFTLTVLPPAPAITSAGTASGAVGKAFSYQITATSAPTSYGVLGLPPGLHADAKTGLISGTPTKAGQYSLTLKAANGSGTGEKTLALTIQGVPVITSTATANAKIGQAFSYQITATNTPTSFLVANNQPGLVLDRSTGLLTGTPKGPAGTFALTLKAANAAGTGEKTLTITITK